MQLSEAHRVFCVCLHAAFLRIEATFSADHRKTEVCKNQRLKWLVTALTYHAPDSDSSSLSKNLPYKRNLAATVLREATLSVAEIRVTKLVLQQENNCCEVV